MHNEASRDFLQFHDLGADTLLSIIDRAQVMAAVAKAYLLHAQNALLEWIAA